jgi:hypothetical protein
MWASLRNGGLLQIFFRKSIFVCRHVFEHLLVDCASVLSRSGDGRVRTLLFRCVKAMLSVENVSYTHFSNSRIS